MKCEICGAENAQGTTYCSNCGHKFNKENGNVDKNYTADKTAASIVLGVISIILAALMIPIAPVVTAIIGIVFSMKSKDDNKIIGIILNVSALLIKLLYILFYIFILLIILFFVSAFSEDYYHYDSYEPHEIIDTSEIEGTYFCKKDGSEEYSDIVTIDSERLRIEDFDNPKETYLVGSYTSSYDGYNQEYELTVYVDEEYNNGDKETENHEMEVSIDADYDSMNMMIDNRRFYQCDRIENGV